MEEWFHAKNPKAEVHASIVLIGKTLQLIKYVFPRTDIDGEEVGQGWSLPKFHATTKFREYMVSFGSAINFFGGVGECNHKIFVKSAGFNTQKRIKNFTSQVATRYYEAMTFEVANKCLEKRRRNSYIDKEDTLSRQHRTTVTEGKFILTIEELQENGLFNNFIVNNMSTLSINLIQGIAIYAAREMNRRNRFIIVRFTACKLRIDERDEIFRCTSKYSRDGQWYDWCLIEWVNAALISLTYPGLILGFIQVEEKYCAVVQLSNDPISMEKMTQEFICKFNLPSKEHSNKCG
jgi:hypothetical protein